MPLSPIDVQQQTFKVALRGYAEDEVDEFLDQVVISLRDYEQRVRDAQERVAVLEEQLSANRETEDAMRRTFLAAQRTADSIVEDARTDAEKMLEEARAEADRTVTDARAEVDRVLLEQTEEKARLLSETAMLRDRVHGLRAALRDLAGSALGRLDDLDAEGAIDRINATVRPMDTPPAEPPPRPAPIELDDLDIGSPGEYRSGAHARIEDEESLGDDEVFPEPEEPSGESDEEESGDDVARVPDWMKGDEGEDSSTAYRRPWERDDG